MSGHNSKSIKLINFQIPVSIHVALSIADFHDGKTEKEEAKLKKWQKFVKDMKVPLAIDCLFQNKKRFLKTTTYNL